HRAARPDGRGARSAGAQRADRRGGAATRGRRDLRHRALQSRARSVSDRSRRASGIVAVGACRVGRECAMRRVRFWGTRGSLPVALTAADVRAKVIAALRGASGRTFSSDDDLADYVDALEPEVAGTFGGHTSCVEIETGGSEYVVCDL